MSKLTLKNFAHANDHVLKDADWFYIKHNQVWRLKPIPTFSNLFLSHICYIYVHILYVCVCGCGCTYTNKKNYLGYANAHI